MMIWCGMAVKRMGMLGVSDWKMKAMTLEMAALIGNRTQNDMFCVLNV
jgi:hypothetical protein